MKLARVFPRRTTATPKDEGAFVGTPPLGVCHFDEVHVSCAFTYDIQRARGLARAWAPYCGTVRVGGPAFGDPGGEFVPGRYLKPGMTITSRGCVRACTFCLVPRREGPLRLLDIKPGWDILDNNLLACPRAHIEGVLSMLEDQPRAARFTGGIDARLVVPWFAKRLAAMRLDILYTAYDHPDEAVEVYRTVRMLRDAGLSQRSVGCYVLVGTDGDTPAEAEKRLRWVFDAGATPFAMYYKGPTEHRRRIPHAWYGLVRRWSRPAIIYSHQGQTDQREGCLWHDREGWRIVARANEEAPCSPSS